MARAVYRVTHPEAPRLAADPGIAAIAGHVRDEAAARTPVLTGTLQAGWQVTEGHGPGSRKVINTVPYARFVEYGTRNMAAEPMFGPVIAQIRGSQ